MREFIIKNALFIHIHLNISYILFSFVCLIVLRIGSNTPKLVCCHHPIRAGCTILGKLFKPYCEEIWWNNIQVTILLWRWDNLRQSFTTCKVLCNIEDYIFSPATVLKLWVLLELNKYCGTEFNLGMSDSLNK